MRPAIGPCILESWPNVLLIALGTSFFYMFLLCKSEDEYGDEGSDRRRQTRPRPTTTTNDEV
jgi:hypothetical protein